MPLDLDPKGIPVNESMKCVAQMKPFNYTAKLDGDEDYTLPIEISITDIQIQAFNQMPTNGAFAKGR